MMNLVALEHTDFEIITEETEHGLLQTLMWWYKEESEREDEPPNLHYVLADQHQYTHSLFDYFAESLCWRRFHDGYGPNPNSEDFDHTQYDMAMEELSVCYEHYFPMITRDVMKILNQLNMTYFFKENASGIEDIYNSPIQEVW